MTLRTTNNCRSLRQGTTYRRCKLWRIVKRNGGVLHLTDHNRNVRFNGAEFIAAKSGETSDKRRDAGLKAGNQEFRTIVSDLITVEELAAGFYDTARIDEWEVDWKFPWAGAFSTNVYFIDSANFSGETLQADAVTAAQLLEANIGSSMDVDCPWRLGGYGCFRALSDNSDPASWSASHFAIVRDRVVTDTVGDLQVEATSIPATYSDRTYSDGSTDVFFQFGRIHWTAGSNAGTWANVVGYEHGNRLLTLASKTGFAVEIGDRFDLYGGCDRRRITCKEKWDNLRQFMGFEFIPTGRETLDPP